MKSKLIVNLAALVTLGLALGMNAFADTDGFGASSGALISRLLKTI